MVRRPLHRKIFYFFIDKFEVLGYNMLSFQGEDLPMVTLERILSLMALVGVLIPLQHCCLAERHPCSSGQAESLRYAPQFLSSTGAHPAQKGHCQQPATRDAKGECECPEGLAANLGVAIDESVTLRNGRLYFASLLLSAFVSQDLKFTQFESIKLPLKSSSPFPDHPRIYLLNASFLI